MDEDDIRSLLEGGSNSVFDRLDGLACPSREPAVRFIAFRHGTGKGDILVIYSPLGGHRKTPNNKVDTRVSPL